MKKIILLIVILGIAFGLWYLNKINKEKAIFNGQTKAQIIRKLRALWKPEFENAQRIWINKVYDEDSTYQTEYDEKMEKSGKSLDEQITGDIKWLWDNHVDNRHPYNYGGWRTRWIVAQTEDNGIDSTMPEVIEMMSKV